MEDQHRPFPADFRDKPGRGHNLQVLTDAYLLTWDERYRLAAEKIIENTAPEKQWYCSEDGRKANPDKRVDGFWTAAICINAAARYTEVMEEKTGAAYEKGRRYVTGYADFVSRYLASGPETGFHTVWSPAKGGGGRGYEPWTYRITDVVMYGHKFTSDPELKKRCLNAARDAFISMDRQYGRQPGWLYQNSKANTMIVGGGHEYTHYVQNGGWKK